MPKIFVTTREGVTQALDGKSGESVMGAIRNAGIDELLALCGGCCSCATCHVYVDSVDFERLPPLSADEDEMLESLEHREKTSRLSCQLLVQDTFDDFRVTIAPEE